MSKQITIELSNEQLQKINQLRNTREGKTEQEMVAQALDRGLYDLCYRTKRNKEQWAQFKEWKAQQQQ